MPRYSKAEQDEAKAALRAMLPAGSTVHLSLQNVSRSGMSRNIKCLAIVDGSPRNISRLVAIATGFTLVAGFDQSVRIGGCGMDMGLALVDHLSYELYSKPLDQSSKRYPEEANGGLRYNWL